MYETTLVTAGLLLNFTIVKMYKKSYEISHMLGALGTGNSKNVGTFTLNSSHINWIRTVARKCSRVETKLGEDKI